MKHIGAGGLTPILAVLVLVPLCVLVVVVRVLT